MSDKKKMSVKEFRANGYLRLVEYRKLPAYQRAKDTIFGAVIRGLMEIE
jgi:hypothetical protein